MGGRKYEREVIAVGFVSILNGSKSKSERLIVNSEVDSGVTVSSHAGRTSPDRVRRRN